MPILPDPKDFHEGDEVTVTFSAPSFPVKNPIPLVRTGVLYACRGYEGSSLSDSLWLRWYYNGERYRALFAHGDHTYSKRVVSVVREGMVDDSDFFEEVDGS